MSGRREMYLAMAHEALADEAVQLSDTLHHLYYEVAHRGAGPPVVKSDQDRHAEFLIEALRAIVAHAPASLSVHSIVARASAIADGLSDEHRQKWAPKS